MVTAGLCVLLNFSLHINRRAHGEEKGKEKKYRNKLLLVLSKRLLFFVVNVFFHLMFCPGQFQPRACSGRGGIPAAPTWGADTLHTTLVRRPRGWHAFCIELLTGSLRPGLPQKSWGGASRHSRFPGDPPSPGIAQAGAPRPLPADAADSAVSHSGRPPWAQARRAAPPAGPVP